MTSCNPFYRVSWSVKKPEWKAWISINVFAYKVNQGKLTIVGSFYSSQIEKSYHFVMLSLQKDDLWIRNLSRLIRLQRVAHNEKNLYLINAFNILVAQTCLMIATTMLDGEKSNWNLKTLDVPFVVCADF